MKRWFWILLLLAVTAGAVWIMTGRSTPPEVPFAKAQRGTLVSVLSTNGKAEPLEWAPVRAERAGRVLSVDVKRGQQVAAGQVVVQMESGEARAALASAQAHAAQARADVEGLQRGGRASELSTINSEVNRLQLERDAAQRDAASLERLAAKHAATQVELDAARDRVAQIDAQISAQKERKATLVGHDDLAVAQARLKEAESAVEVARKQLERSSIRSPRQGVVYELGVRAGDWLNAGDLAAKVGETSKLRVVVYIDEPDLGRVRKGLPVSITWDALLGREWKGEVEQTPSEVISIGSRQVGEVVTIADNPQMDLPPGANINARVRSQVVENALTIPKSALRREGGEFGVFVLEGTRLAWRHVKVGASSEARAEIQDGLRDGDAVALPTERELKSGMDVSPVFP